MQLDSSPKGSRSPPQRISLGPSPRSPLDDYCETERQQSLSQLPLQLLNPPARVFVTNVNGKGVHPFVRRKANSLEFAFERPGKRVSVTSDVVAQ